MFKSSLFAGLILLLGTLSSIAQQKIGAGDTGSIRGIVIDTKTSQPIPGSTVSLHGVQASAESDSVASAADGSFVFRNLAGGRYRLSASHNGYVGSGGGRGPAAGRLSGVTIFVGAGQEMDDVVLRLTPTGVISGRITNERDEPMRGVFVETMKRNYRSGQREFSQGRGGFSDERGEFRIAGLNPGRYYIRAASPRGEKQPAGDAVYLPTFYPGVVDPVQSQALELHAGEELNGIKLNLSRSRAVHVKGRILTSKAAPAKNAEITLAQTAGGSYSVDAKADAAGRFDVAGIPPGSFALTAQLSDGSDSGPVLMGHTIVQVADTNVDAGDVVVLPGATVAGRVVVEGDHKLGLRGSASLIPVETAGVAGNVGSTSVESDGSFVFHDVPDGSYRIGLHPLPAGYYLKRADGGEAADVGVVVSHGHAAPAEVQVVFGAGRIQGTVYRDTNHEEAAPSATVVLVPDAKLRGNSEYYRAGIADRSGRFSLASVPPGDYSLFAWQDIERDSYTDPEFLQQYESAGKAVHVEEGSNVTVQLQLAD